MAPHSSTLAWKNPMDGRAWKAAVHGVAKVLEISALTSVRIEYSGLISFRIEWFDLLALQGTLKSLL